MKIKNLERYKGKILVKETENFIWMFKVVDVYGVYMKVTQGMDIFPEPRAYKGLNSFNKFYDEFINLDITRLPTKEELNLYRKYTRELRVLGTNLSDYGRK